MTCCRKPFFQPRERSLSEDEDGGTDEVVEGAKISRRSPPEVRTRLQPPRDRGHSPAVSRDHVFAFGGYRDFRQMLGTTS